MSRGVYLRVGLGLTALKYAVEATVVALVGGEFFTPWMFLLPDFGSRRESLGEYQYVLGILWAVWTVPFVCVAFSMTLRRALDCGRSVWWGLLIFVPVLNVVTMLVFAALPSKARSIGESSDPVPPGEIAVEVPPRNLVRLFVAMALSAGMAGTMFGIAVYGVGEYGAALFFGTPLAMGMLVSVYTYDPRGRTAHFGNACLATIVCLGMLFAIGFEGAICLVMAAPLVLLLAFLGSAFGTSVCRASTYPRSQTGLAIAALPLWAGMDAWSGPPEVRAVSTSVIVAAPPETVWRNVIAFPNLGEPDELVFRLGIAAPVSAEIEGRGVGAVRRCNFTTGTFVEPITTWQEPTLLAFDVTEQPDPMTELSPYQHVHPPHLEGSMRSVRGEFRLTRLADGRTELRGTTWYRIDMHPQIYWTLWSDWLIHAIHLRVLRHIARVSES